MLGDFMAVKEHKSFPLKFLELKCCCKSNTCGAVVLIKL